MTRRNDGWLGLAAGLGLALLAGCNSVNSVERASPEAPRQMVADQRVITDRDFEQRVGIVGVNEGHTDGGLVRIQVELRNHTHSAQSFLYRFEWFDQDGIQVDSPGQSLIPRTIEGGESLFLVGVAPKPAAKDFRLKIIEQ